MINDKWKMKNQPQWVSISINQYQYQSVSINQWVSISVSINLSEYQSVSINQYQPVVKYLLGSNLPFNICRVRSSVTHKLLTLWSATPAACSEHCCRMALSLFAFAFLSFSNCFNNNTPASISNTGCCVYVYKM